MPNKPQVGTCTNPIPDPHMHPHSHLTIQQQALNRYEASKQVTESQRQIAEETVDIANGDVRQTMLDV